MVLVIDIIDFFSFGKSFVIASDGEDACEGIPPIGTIEYNCELIEMNR